MIDEDLLISWGFRPEWGYSDEHGTSWCHDEAQARAMVAGSSGYSRLQRRWIGPTESTEVRPSGSHSIAVWSEGYSATGEHGGATLMGIVEASDFDEAVRILRDRDTDPALWRQNPDGTWRYWGCRLFDNRPDAQKSFG